MYVRSSRLYCTSMHSCCSDVLISIQHQLRYTSLNTHDETVTHNASIMMLRKRIFSKSFTLPMSQTMLIKIKIAYDDDISAYRMRQGAHKMRLFCISNLRSPADSPEVDSQAGPNIQ